MRKLWFLCLIFCASLVYAQTETVLDTFSVVSYSNSDGSQPWAGDWQDSEDNSAAAGLISVTSGELRFRGVSGPDPFIERTLNLSGATTATLSFAIRTNNNLEGNDSFRVSIRSSSTGGFVPLETFSNDISASRSYDITPYISDATTVRFEVLTYVFGTNEYYFIDDVQFSYLQPAPTYSISGRLFEDINYGGGAGRDYMAANLSAQASGFAADTVAVDSVAAIVELYDASGTYLQTVGTDANGDYQFTGLADGSYYVRVVSSLVKSQRPGGGGAELGVQTFRSVGGVTVNNEVGGFLPGVADAPAFAVGSSLNPATYSFVGGPLAGQQAQSVTAVTLSGADQPDTNFGFNFTTVVNTNDSAQGSLRQFLLNSNTLANTNLAQDGLVAGEETSIFMVSDGNAHPGLRAGLPNLLSADGVAVISPLSLLPMLSDAGTRLDGSTQTQNIGDTNSGQLGIGGTVGLDNLPLSQVNAPELELIGSSALARGLDINARTTITGLAIHGFGSAVNLTDMANIYLRAAASNTVIEATVIGSGATSFAGLGVALGNDPCGAATSSADNVYATGADSVTVQNNLIGYAAGTGLYLESAADNWLIENNEVRCNGIGNAIHDSIAVEVNSQAATIRSNLIIHSEGMGIDSFAGAGNLLVSNNSITQNGIGASGSSADETAGIRLYGTANEVSRNLIFDNVGAGVMVTASASSLVTQNSMFGNGTRISKTGQNSSGQIGIDLHGLPDNLAQGSYPFVTANDNGDTDTGGNGLLNFPVLESAELVGSDLIISGFAPAGSSIELFIADSAPNPEPLPASFTSSFGEGKTFVASFLEGSSNDTDTTVGTYVDDGTGSVTTKTQARFTFTLPSASIPVGSRLTATASSAGSTSEFGNVVTVLTPGGLFCPVGTLVPQAGHAIAATSQTTSSSYDPNDAVGAPSPIGSVSNNTNAIRVNSTNRFLILEVKDLVPENADIEFSLAPDNTSADISFEVSPDGTAWLAAGTFVAGSNTLDRLMRYNVTVPSGSGGARFIRINRNRGGTWIDAASYSEVCLLPDDYGDAPLSYGVASHTASTSPTLYLGVNPPDTEASSRLGGDAGLGADGDDTDGFDDEDGVTGLFFTPGQVTSLDIPVTGSGFLNAWIDWNSDGDFDDTVGGVSEQVAIDVQDGDAADSNSATDVIGLAVSVPSGLANGSSYARFRWSSASGLSPTGLAPDGEVEDYDVAISDLVLSGSIFRDLNLNDSFDSTETGIASITVSLYQDDGDGLYEAGTDDVQLGVASTDAAGDYSFIGLGDGTYWAAVDVTDGDLPGGYLPGNLTALLVTVVGSSVSQQDFPFDPPGGAFPPCDPFVYLFQNDPTDAYALNLATGSSFLIAPDIGPANRGLHINGIGYSVFDDYLYGGNSTDRNGTISRINSNFEVTLMGPIPNLPAFGFYVGDVSADGKLYLHQSGIMYVIDLDPSSPEYLELTVIPLSTSISITDWAFNPIDFQLYTIHNSNHHLYRINPATGVVTDLGDTGITGATTFGGQYYDADGFLYMSKNQDGEIYRVDTSNPANIDPTAVLFSNGPSSSLNDGAHCMFAKLPIDFGDAPFETLLVDDGARHVIEVFGPHLGSNLPDAETDGQPDVNAEGDDVADVDDEDGVTLAGAALNGRPLAADLPVSFDVATSRSGYLNAWIDWNRNGSFEPSEQIANNIASTGGVMSLAVTPPSTLLPGTSYARFRYSSDANLAPTGPASDGEVEDYRVELFNTVIMGSVFLDDGFDVGTAHNAIQDGGELGLSAVTVTASDGSNLTTALTANDGTYTLYIPDSFGANVTLSHTLVPATGTSIAGTTSPACLALDFADPAASEKLFGDADCSGMIDGSETGLVKGFLYSGYDFGVVRPSSLSPDNTGQVASPGVLEYSHSFTPGTLGNVTLYETTGTLNYQLFVDENCDGSFAATEGPHDFPYEFSVDDMWPRLADSSLASCGVTLRVLVPPGIDNTFMDLATLSAELEWENQVVIDSVSAQDTTTIANAGFLDLDKAVCNFSQSCTSYDLSGQGKPGEILEYLISYQNDGVEPVFKLNIKDTIPFFTTLSLDEYGTGELELRCPDGTVQSLETGQVSAIEVDVMANCAIPEILPGEGGYLKFRVRIN